MKKKTMILAALGVVSTLGALSVVALGGAKAHLAKVEATPVEHTLTIDKTTIHYNGWLGHHVVTENGNTIALSANNGDFWRNYENLNDEEKALPSENSFCFVRGNGVGFYISAPFQNVVSVTATFSYSNTEAGNHLDMAAADTNNTYENSTVVTSRSGEAVVPSVTADRYIHFWYSAGSSTNVISFESVVVTYTCV